MSRFPSVPQQISKPWGATISSNHFSKFIRQAMAGIVFLSMLAVNISAGADERKAETKMQVSATILTMLKIRVTSQPSQFNIEQKHVTQGYVDVSDASAMLITSNSPAGFMMSVTHDSEMVSGVTATLSQGGTKSEGGSQMSVRTQQVRDEPMRISYRLYLNAQARVGSQPWPVALSFTPSAA